MATTATTNLNVPVDLTLTDDDEYTSALDITQTPSQPENLIVKREDFLLAASAPSTDDIRDENLARIEILILCIIFTLTLVGNGLMLLAIHRQLQFRPMSRMYYFMLNLCLADILVGFGHILPQIAWDITYRFKGNDLLCRAVKFSQVFVLYLSTFILTSMALDRYLVVCHPSFSRTHYSGIKGLKTLITISWVASILLAIPQPIIFSYQEIQDGIYDCWVHFADPWDKVYVTWFVVCAFIFPLMIILGSYGAICVKVVRFSLPPKTSSSSTTSSSKGVVRMDIFGTGSSARMKPLVSLSSEKTSEDNTMSKSLEDITAQLKAQNLTTERQALKRQIGCAKIKTLKLTLVIVICFIVCLAPFCFAQLIMVYNPPESAKEVQPINVIFLLLASLNSCTNPWIYLFFSESLCNQLRMCLRIGLLRGSNNESIGDDQVAPAAPKPKKPRRIITGDQHLQHGFNERMLVKVDNHDQKMNIHEDEIIVETKSEIFPNTTSKDKVGSGATICNECKL